MVFLGPFGETKPGIDASDEPVSQNMVDQKRSGRKAKRVLVVYHLDCEGFTAVLHVFPAFDFIEAGRDFRC